MPLRRRGPSRLAGWLESPPARGGALSYPLLRAYLCCEAPSWRGDLWQRWFLLHGLGVDLARSDLSTLSGTELHDLSRRVVSQPPTRDLRRSEAVKPPKRCLGDVATYGEHFF